MINRGDSVKKIGRNSPCPCGSGKKYKKCCLISDQKKRIELNDIQNRLFAQSEFPQIESKIPPLRSIISEYNFRDLIIAIYCINISLDNRSALENSLTLNAALLTQDIYGSKKIDTYEEFLSFFKRIEKKLIVSVMEDYTIEDFGEVKLNWKNKVYNVIIGTGHNQVFGMLQFIPYLSEILEKEDELEQLLEYSSETIEFFKRYNKSNGDENIKYLAPSEELFYKTIEYFDIYLKRNNFNSIANLLNSNSDIPIEKMHFILNGGQAYPLFNTSILVDIYDIWIKKLDEKQNNRLVNYTIQRILNEMFKMHSDGNFNIIFPCSILKDGKFISKAPYAFFAITKRGAILAINECNYSNDELQTEFQNMVLR